MSNIFDVLNTSVKEVGKTIRLNKQLVGILFVTAVYSAMFIVASIWQTDRLVASINDLRTVLISRQISMGGR